LDRVGPEQRLAEAKPSEEPRPGLLVVVIASSRASDYAAAPQLQQNVRTGDLVANWRDLRVHPSRYPPTDSKSVGVYVFQFAAGKR
jgi:hypothetical protein